MAPRDRPRPRRRPDRTPMPMPLPMPRASLAPAALSLLLAAGCAGGSAPAASTPSPAEAPATTTRALVTRMHDRWAGRFWHTLLFRQHNTLYRADGSTEPSEWVELQSVPRRLRIEFLPAETRGGLLFRNDSSYTFQNGRMVAGRPTVHPLLLLSADVYALPVDTTMHAIGGLAIDTTRLRRDSLDGRPVYVVGAAAGDTTANQFWIDAERMLLLRVIQRGGGARVVISDTRFTAWQEVDGLPVPKSILFLRDGKPSWREEYLDARLGVAVTDADFDPARWAERFGLAARTTTGSRE